MDSRPLADRARPTKLSQVIGQEHLIGDGKLLSELIKSGKAFSLILWGPPGSGKTTLARILAKEIGSDFIELSAVASGKKDVMKVIEDARTNQRLGMQTILFVDEIHRFNKSQQDAFLPHVESGLITLIGATTENPSFEVITPLISRSRVVVLQPLDKDNMIKLIKRGIKHSGIRSQRLSKKSIDLIAEQSAGDGRTALNTLELAISLSRGNKITPDLVTEAIQKKLPSYDKNGDMHHDSISAFIKSMRGSDANASLYYLARMLRAGEDPKFIARRMIVFASEDIGIAASPALNLAVSTFLAVERIGMPECQYNLFHCALVLAKADKSRLVTDAMTRALAAAEEQGDLKIPLHLRNAPTKLMKELGYNKDYQWKAGYKHGKGFLPPELSDLNFFK